MQDLTQTVQRGQICHIGHASARVYWADGTNDWVSFRITGEDFWHLRGGDVFSGLVTRSSDNGRLIRLDDCRKLAPFGRSENIWTKSLDFPGNVVANTPVLRIG